MMAQITEPPNTPETNPDCWWGALGPRNRALFEAQRMVPGTDPRIGYSGDAKISVSRDPDRGCPIPVGGGRTPQSEIKPSMQGKNAVHRTMTQWANNREVRQSCIPAKRRYQQKKKDTPTPPVTYNARVWFLSWCRDLAPPTTHYTLQSCCACGCCEMPPWGTLFPYIDFPRIT